MRERHAEKIRHIGLRIAYFRKMRTLTQEDLAHQIHINKYYLSQIETGSCNKTISLPLLIDISEVLDIKLSSLVNLDDMNEVGDP